METKLMNSNQFSKRCGVSAQTILNWVALGKIKPAKEIEGKYYFSEDDVIRFKISSVKSSATQSFLGVIVESSETLIKEKESDFENVVRSVCPNVFVIEDLETAIKESCSSIEDSISVPSAVINPIVAEAFSSEVRNSVISYISGIQFDVAEVEYFPLSFFLDVLFERGADFGLIERYNSINVGKINYTIDGFTLRLKSLFDSIKSNYGVYNAIAELGLSFEDCFYGRVSALGSENCDINMSCSSSKAIYNKVMKEFKRKASNQGVRTIFNSGYMKTIESIGKLSEGQEHDIIGSIVRDEFKTLYITSRSILTPVLSSVVDSAVSSGKLQLIVVDELL